MVPTRRQVLAAAASTTALAGCVGTQSGTPTAGGGDGATDAPTRSPTEATADQVVAVHDHADLGEIIVDTDGMVLYMFDSDTQGAGASTCAGDCAEAWPPLTVEEDPTPGEGVTAELTTFEREDGATQVAADGWPLYYFASDAEPGQANGQGVGGVWWVVRPDGTPVRAESTATPDSTEVSTETATTAGTPTVQVRSTDEYGPVLVGPEGLSLYMFDSDTQGAGASTCTGDCADAWPPLTVEGDPTPGEGVTAELTTFERDDGATQVAADGWPLYYFASDEAPGDTTGQGRGGVWWLLGPDGTPIRSETPTPAPTATQSETPGGDTPTATATDDPVGY